MFILDLFFILLLNKTSINSHLVMNRPEVWGISDAVSLEYPLDTNTVNPVCAGRAPDTTAVIELVAGNTYDFEIICGEMDFNAPGCLVGDWHAGDNVDDFSGCALSVAYEEHTQQSNHKYISYSRDCARRGSSSTFVISQNVQNCENCVCSWSWAPSRMYSSPGQFYSNCFYCTITGGILSNSTEMRSFDFINIQGTNLLDTTYNDINPVDIYSTREMIATSTTTSVPTSTSIPTQEPKKCKVYKHTN